LAVDSNNGIINLNNLSKISKKKLDINKVGNLDDKEGGSFNGAHNSSKIFENVRDNILVSPYVYSAVYN
jgi:hypothetical protein